jgi:hypothetical protein
MTKVKLRRLGPQYYETLDSRYRITGYYVDAKEGRGYGAGWRWYIEYPTGARSGDIWATKRECVEVLAAHIAQENT